MNKQITFLTILLLFCLLSCSNNGNNQALNNNQKTNSIYHYSWGQIYKDLEIYEIDSCEYIGTLNITDADVLTHRGRCKYCKIRNNK